jgi:polyketide-type polyunsaturated fatty acid synthase PfaA
MTDFKNVAAPKGHGDIAVVGMAGMFPGAPDLSVFWKNIIKRVNSIREVDPGRWRVEDFFDENPRSRDGIYSKWGGFLEDIPFDPTEFGIPPVTLKSVDAVQLLALKVSKKALEDAGFFSRQFPKDKTAVIFGAGGMHDQCIDYVFRTMLGHYLPKLDSVGETTKASLLEDFRGLLPEWTEDSFPGILGNVISGRVANRLDLKGPNFTVDAACASSLAALDVAVSKLRSGQVDAALVGAVDITDNVMGFMAFARTFVLSPEGKSRPFDDQANGIVISEGVAALVLKRLEDAKKDGDRIHAVIKGIGSSSDGKNRSLTAPHFRGQLLAIQRAFDDASVNPHSIGLIEAHGTGTVVGDESEFNALQMAFDASGSENVKCALGSVKSNIGHTKVTAGLSGLIKGILAVKHRILPATMGIEKPNSRIDLARTGFYFNTESRPWLTPPGGGPRRCGVSAFGFGGTNFHVVLEEYGEEKKNPSVSTLADAEIFTFSSESKSKLITLLEEIDESLKHPEQTETLPLAGALYAKSLEMESRGAGVRLNIVAESALVLKAKLKTALEKLQKDSVAFEQDGIYYQEGPALSGKVCFLFPGQGSQRVNMLRDLLMAFPACREAFENADAVLEGWFEQPLSSYVYPEPSFSRDEQILQNEALNQTDKAQPAMAAADLAVLALLTQFGIKTDVTAGHSFGEYIALHAAGVIGLEDVLRLAAMRGKFSGEASLKTRGKMAAVMTDSDTARRIIEESGTGAWVSNINSPGQTILGGTETDIEKCMEAAGIRGVKSRKIPVTAAFHTPLMEKTAEKLAAEIAKIKIHKPALPVFSNTTGGTYPKTPAAIGRLLARHIQEPLDFITQINNLYKSGAYYFIEAGPGNVLGGLVDRILEKRPHVTLRLDHSERSGLVQAAHFFARAHSLGISVDLSKWFNTNFQPAKSLETVLNEAARRINPPPTTWRIRNGKLKPWHLSPDSIRAGEKPAGKKSVKLTDESHKILTLNPRPSKGPVEDEIMHPDHQSEKKPQSSNVSPESRDLILKIQSNLGQFIELQRSQQKLMEQFLSMQQQLVDATLNGNGNGHGSMAKVPGTIPEVKPAVRPAMETSANVPPVPVLPKLTSLLGDRSSAPAAEIVKPKALVPGETRTLELSSSQSVGRFQADLLRTVSELTGYPEEMLGLDAHLEADLGIDSIKRVEILSLLEEHHPLLEANEEEAVLEELTRLNTLRKIVQWYENNLSRMQEKEKQSLKKT